MPNKRKAITAGNIDPTRSITLRRSLSQSLTNIFVKLRREIVDLIVKEDALGLKDDISILQPMINYDFSSTQFNILDKDVLTEIRKIQNGLSSTDTRKLESTPHVTIRYGLLDQPRMVDGIRTLLNGIGPITVSIGELSLFDTPESDVLKFSVESEHLRELNARLKLLPNYQDYQQYSPHITIAYLKKGTGEKYLSKSSLTGKKITFDTVVYSDTEKNKTEVILVNKRWKYTTQAEAIEQFDKWLDGKIESLFLTQAEVAKWRKYVERAFKKGVSRAFDDSGKSAKQRAKDVLRSQGFTEGRREEFFRQTYSKATAIEKVKLLTTRAMSEVKGMTRDLRTKARRVLTDGLVKSQSPTQIANALSKELGISKTRAQTIVNTELVRAHADGQLEAMEQLGVDEVGLAVEWSTSGKACRICQPLKGIVLSLPEARGLLPRHPNCRCAWLPADKADAEERRAQKRGKYKIDRALKQSQKRADDDWGPGEIDRQRPKVNCECSDSLFAFAKLLEQVEIK